MKFLKYILSIIFLTSSIFLYAQTAASIKIIPFGINSSSDPNSAIFTRKITSGGFITFEPGIQFSLEFFGNNNTSIKFIQEYNKDQMNHNAGFSQVLVKYQVLKTNKNTILLGIGPILHYRKSWTDIADYQDEGIYKTYGLSQFKVSWFSGEIEFNHYLNKKTDFSISINHLHPKSIGIFFGYKYWISRKSYHCTTCPSYH